MQSSFFTRINPEEIRAIAFDVNGTLIDILTDESMEEIYRSLRHFLAYQGIDMQRGQLRDLYFQKIKEMQAESKEQYPEYDAVTVWRRILDQYANDYSRGMPEEKWLQMPLFLAEMYRSISRKRLQLFPNVLDVLNKLRVYYRIGIVTDAQSAYARGELHKVGILNLFDPVVVSGDYGYRKPDARLFRAASDAMRVTPEQTLFIGNDMYRDVYGANQAGMKTALFAPSPGKQECQGVTPDVVFSDYSQLPSILRIGG